VKTGKQGQDWRARTRMVSKEETGDQGGDERASKEMSKQGGDG
jgi:hypothetical protein